MQIISTLINPPSKMLHPWFVTIFLKIEENNQTPAPAD